MGTSARNSSREGSMMKAPLFPIISLMNLLLTQSSPVADADALVLGSAVHASGNTLSPNCKQEGVEVFTQNCSPTAESFCIPNTLDTEEIEFEKVCVDVENTICDDPTLAKPAFTAHKYKRAADAKAKPDAEAEALLHGSHSYPAVAAGHHGHHGHPAPLPALVGAISHPATATIQHPCHQVTTQHCFDSPKVKKVSVDVENCHTVTKVSCTKVKHNLPKTVCTPVTTSAVHHPLHHGVLQVPIHH